MLLAIIQAIGAIPALESMVNSFIAAWLSYQKEKEGAQIDTAVKSGANPVTSEDVKKEAQDAAKATRDL